MLLARFLGRIDGDLDQRLEFVGEPVALPGAHVHRLHIGRSGVGMGDTDIVDGLACQAQGLDMVGDAAPKDRQVGRYIKTVHLQRGKIVHFKAPYKGNNHAQGIGSREESMRETIRLFDLAQTCQRPVAAWGFRLNDHTESIFRPSGRLLLLKP